MNCVRACLFLVCLALVGCGKTGPTDPGGPPPPPAQGSKGGPPGGRRTIDNVGRIQIGMSTLNDAKQMFGVDAQMTNDEKPGLGAGSRWVWKEDNKKVYVSIGIDGKATGVAWEGFAGR